MDKISLPEYDAVSLDDVAKNVVGLHLLFVNLFAVSSGSGWTLLDAGIPYSAGRIKKWAEEKFGKGTRPQSIVLTHGHFDHAGSLEELLKHWDVPVYAHPLEMPYLTGKAKYRAPDPLAGGGMMALMSPFYPRGPYDLSGHVRPLPEDGFLPGVNGWKWIHTPGHTPGHVCFYREEDGVLVVGDAFCTTQSESMTAAATQRTELHGPPAYFTSDWAAAQRSVEDMARLRAHTLAPGHGQPVTGDDVPDALNNLARDFVRIAVPEHAVAS